MSKKMKHNYTSELELKSLLIRIKNRRLNIGIDKCDEGFNEKIDKYIDIHTRVSNKTLIIPGKKTVLKNNLKKRIIDYSEKTASNDEAYERFGEIILLMIKKILTKPQFSGYTYKDDFYSDAIYKILKYLGNFNHKLISKISGFPVNAFAYISQIIHNSILYILNTKKKEKEKLNKQVQLTELNHNLQFVYTNWHATPESEDHIVKKEIYKKITLENIDSLEDELIKLEDEIKKYTRIDIIYPIDYIITFDEYDKLKPLLKGKVNIIKEKIKEECDEY